MRRLALSVVPAILLATGPVQAGPVTVTSAGPATVAVTVYRDPAAAGAIDLRAPAGFALVTETRRVRLPKGAAVLRFEGVADGIVPVSAIVTGLPGGIVELNRDARLLSPAALVDGTLGRAILLTRTDPVTGRARSEPATIVAGPAEGVVVRTATGIETLRCAGLPETLRFAGVPAGLSAEPVLSVATVTPAARTVTVTLSYLASGFDWRASYVATVAADGARLNLFAWLTLANGNPERFADAQVQAVAGRLNRTATQGLLRQAGALRLSCYPLGTTTSDLRERRFEPAEEIVVMESRMAMAAPPPPAPMEMVSAPAPPPPLPPEDLGDLKLYRVPWRVTIAPRGQKQVALLVADGVGYERRYRRTVWPGQALVAAPTAIALRLRNDRAGGLGMPLPAGTTALYADRAGTRLLLGTGEIADRAEGETLWIGAGTSRQVLVTQRREADDGIWLAVTNANPFAITAEIAIGGAGQAVKAEGLTRIDGVATWVVTVPARGNAELAYRVP